MEQLDNVYEFPPPKEGLTQEQKEYWQERLLFANRARDYALRMLGRLPIEEEIEE